MGNNQQALNILLLGLPQTGKTLLTNYLLSNDLCMDISEKTIYKETLVRYARKRINLIEFGGHVIRHWPDLFCEKIRTLDTLYVFISSESSIIELHKTRNSLMMLYYHYFTHLRNIPLCIIQTCVDSNIEPSIDWETLKRELQLDCIAQFRSVLMIRLVLDEENALQNNLERLLEWSHHHK